MIGIPLEDDIFGVKGRDALYVAQLFTCLPQHLGPSFVVSAHGGGVVEDWGDVA